MPELAVTDAPEESKSRELAQRFAYWFEQTQTRDAEWSKRSRESFHFYMNDTWKPEELQKLAKDQRPALKLNMIRPHINLVVGMALAQDTQLSVLATDPQNDDVSEVLAKLIRYVEFRSNYPSIKGLAFRDGVISGRGWREGFVDFSQNPYGELKYRHVPNSHIKFDTYCQSPDLSDCQYVFRAKWFEPKTFRKLFPKADSLSKVRAGASGMFPTWEEEEIVSRGTDYGNRRMVVEVWWREFKDRYFLIAVDTNKWDMFESRAAAEAARGQNQLAVIIKRTVPIQEYCMTTNDRILTEPADSPYGHRVYPYFPFFPDLTYGVTDGLVEDLKDVQLLNNKTASQTMHIINQTANRSWWFQRGSVDDMDVALSQINRAGGGYQYDGVAPLEVKPVGVPQELLMVWQRAEQLAQLISGLPPALAGQAAGSREPAKAAQLRASQGANVLGNTMHNWFQSEKLRGLWTIDAAQRVLVAPQVIRIVGGSDNPMVGAENIAINQPVVDEMSGVVKVLNDLSVGMFDIRLDNVEGRLTLREEQLQRLIELRSAGAPVPVDTIVEMMDGIPSDVKKRMIAGIQQMQAVQMQNPGAQVNA